MQRPKDSSTYALKRLLNPDRAKRFLREVATMERLHEEGLRVPQVVEQGTDLADRAYFVMPWFARGSLQEAVTDGRFVADAPAGIDTLVDMFTTLEAIHFAELAHRDLKPANVLVGDDGDPVVSDFGLALTVDEAEGDARLTTTTEWIGSRLYAAPENESGFNPTTDQRPADFYSFAKILWALLAGQVPPAREAQLIGPNRLIRRTGSSTLGRLDLLCEQLLIVDPSLRLVDHDGVRQELEAVAGELRGVGVARAGQPRAFTRVLDAAQRYRASDTREQTQEMVGQRETARAAVIATHVPVHAELESWSAGFEELRSMSLEIDIRANQRPPIPFGEVGEFERDSIARLRWSNVDDPESAGSFAGVVINTMQVEIPYVQLLLYSAIRGQEMWWLQFPFVMYGNSEWRLHNPLRPFRRRSGPHRIGLATTTDAGKALARTTSQDAELLFLCYAKILADGESPADWEAWGTALRHHGIRTDARGRVLDTLGEPVRGLTHTRFEETLAGPQPLDLIELVKDEGTWRAGTRATVVVVSEAVTAQLVPPGDGPAERMDLPLGSVRVIWHAPLAG